MIGVLLTLDVGERDEVMSEDVSSAESRIQTFFEVFLGISLGKAKGFETEVRGMKFALRRI